MYLLPLPPSLHLLLISALLLHSTLSTPLHPRAPQLCNGSPSHCTTRYSTIPSTIGAHDSPFIGPLPQQNQNEATSSQLALGARMLQAQTHRSPDDSNVVQLCHTDCRLEDGGSLRDWLGEIKAFLDGPGRENEVVTLLLTNPDGMPLESFHDAFRQSGTDTLSFAPEAGQAEPLELDSWPTLAELIGLGKRLVVFMDTGANTTLLPYILDEFSYFWETPFGELDPDFPDCGIHRPAGASPEGRMYIVNHFLDVRIAADVQVPDRLRADETNSQESIGAQTRLCQGLYGRVEPSFVLLNFVERGDWSRGGEGTGTGAADDYDEGFLCDLLGGFGIGC